MLHSGEAISSPRQCNLWMRWRWWCTPALSRWQGCKQRGWAVDSKNATTTTIAAMTVTVMDEDANVGGRGVTLPCNNVSVGVQHCCCHSLSRGSSSGRVGAAACGRAAVAAMTAAAQQYCCASCCYHCPAAAAGRNTVVLLMPPLLEQWQQLWQKRCGSLQRGSSSSSQQHRHWRWHINIVFPPFLDPTSLLQRGVEV